MKISEHLQKEPWRRRICPDKRGTYHTSHASAAIYKSSRFSDGASYQLLHQDDFLDEISSSAHEINSRYMSTRAIYGPSGEKDAKGKEKWKIVGYDELEAVALGYQERISTQKTAHFAGDGFWISNETKDDANFDRLCSWKDIAHIDTAYLEAVRSCFRTGDAAIYLYRQGSKIKYRVFSCEKGDILFPGHDEEGNEAIYRKYIWHDHEAVDIYTDSYVQTWLNIQQKEDFENDPWLKTVKIIDRSEDGWSLIKESIAQAGRGLNQCVYFRVDDIPSGPGQSAIETLERAASYVSNEVKDSAFPILFVKSEKIVNLPPSKLNGKTIGVKGTSDVVAHSDAKFLAPPDASNIAELNINTLKEEIERSTMSVFIDPDILRSGADSSTTIKIMFTPEIMWCKNQWVYFAEPVSQLVDVFKSLVGSIEGNPIAYDKLLVSCGQNIWIPQNKKEEVDIETSQVYARIKSRKAAMKDAGNQHVGDYELIEKEWEKELEIKSAVPAEAKAKVEQKYGASAADDTIVIEEEDNPRKPKIDNNNKGKTITE